MLHGASGLVNIAHATTTRIVSVCAMQHDLDHETAAALNEDLSAEIAALESELDANACRLETIPVRPRKADIAVEDMALVWRA